MRYPQVLPFLSFLNSACAYVYGYKPGNDFAALSPNETPTGYTDPTGTYFIALQTFKSESADITTGDVYKRVKRYYTGDTPNSEVSWDCETYLSTHFTFGCAETPGLVSDLHFPCSIGSVVEPVTDCTAIGDPIYTSGSYYTPTYSKSYSASLSSIPASTSNSVESTYTSSSSEYSSKFVTSSSTHRLSSSYSVSTVKRTFSGLSTSTPFYSSKVSDSSLYSSSSVHSTYSSVKSSYSSSAVSSVYVSSSSLYSKSLSESSYNPSLSFSPSSFATPSSLSKSSYSPSFPTPSSFSQTYVSSSVTSSYYQSSSSATLSESSLKPSSLSLSTSILSSYSRPSSSATASLSSVGFSSGEDTDTSIGTTLSRTSDVYSYSFTPSSASGSVVTSATVLPVPNFNDTYNGAGQSLLVLYESIDDDDGTIQDICSSSEDLLITFNNSVIRDGQDRVGSIYHNFQLGFAGEEPPAGAIYAAGWSLTDDGYLGLGDRIGFWACPIESREPYAKVFLDKVNDDCFEVQIKVFQAVSECPSA